jgi:ribonuclease VapC
MAILVETSAVFEMMSDGPAATEVFARFHEASVAFHTPAIRVEAGMALIGGHGWPRDHFDSLFAALGTIEIPIDAEIGRLALDAFERYGKGRHKAKLNFGDCLSYAAARRHGLALLYVGRDRRRARLKRKTPGVAARGFVVSPAKLALTRP